MKKFLLSHFNRAIRILLATNALILLAGAMLGPIYAIFVEEIGGDLMDASVAGFLFAITAGLITLYTGKYSDGMRHSDKIVILGYSLIGTGFLLYQLVDSVMSLFAIQILIGIGEAVYSPAFDKLYSKHLDWGKSGTEWGTWESMNYFTAAFGALVGGILVTWLGFAALFYLMAFLSFSSGLYLYVVSPQRVL
ncbi:MFS transporter [Patescibacteria group bacterium]|nr:MFS transporter [Patescibacteria group bacterium]MBU1015868.1 MFS transporter [Patescibacteria group bacterium]MBU1685383.1 MFS transporter [Patescibacteria group bacterium]MBU1938458.1 MFS transporter [Patescibacteria group bacterium]